MATLAPQEATPSWWREASPAFFAGAAAVATTVSIAAYQILLGAAVLGLMLNRSRWRFPSCTGPLLGFLIWTLISLAASPDPAGGLPQLKKLYVFAMLFVVFTALRTTQHVFLVACGWVAGATLSALWAVGQGVRMFLATPQYFYEVYSNQGRITGFADHWMTFSGVLMMALMIAGAMLLHGSRRFVLAGVRGLQLRTRPIHIFPILLAATAILGFALLVGYQRTMYAGAAAGSLWLLGARNKWLTPAVPVAILLVLATNVFHVRDRVLAAFQPQLNILNSGSHRAALRATGWEMIKAHPWFGVGPEQVQRQFLNYAPPSIQRPIPTSWYIGHLHNIYYQYAAERGLPALFFLLWFLCRCLWDFATAVRSLPAGSDLRWMLHAAIAVTLAMMVAGFWEHNLGDSEPLGMFLAVIACGYVVRDLAEKGSNTGEAVV